MFFLDLDRRLLGFSPRPIYVFKPLALLGVPQNLDATVSESGSQADSPVFFFNLFISCFRAQHINH